MNTVTKSEIETTYRRLHKIAFMAQIRYLNDKTPENWAAYLEADEALRPWAVKMGQMMMQEQIDRSDPDTVARYTE